MPIARRVDTDIANLYDSSLGQDIVTVTPTYAALSGSGYYGACGVSTASSPTPRQTALPILHACILQPVAMCLRGGTHTLGSFSAAIPSTGVTVTGFRYVTAYSQGGNHTAYFYGIPNVTDTLSVWLDTGTVARYATAVYNRTVGFSRITAYGDTGENDRAFIYDSTVNDHIAANGLINRRKLTASSAGHGVRT